MLTHLYIFMYIKAYPEAISYSGIFRTIYIFSQFQARYVIQGLLKSTLGMFWAIFRQIQEYLELWLT